MDEEDDVIGIPEWVVTFGDMMSLLLTFFIMLVSLSEIKEEETYQALVDSMQRQFGYARTLDALAPGEQKPRQSAFTTLATTGRAKKKDTANGGVPDKAPVGEEPKVRIVRPGQMTAVGSVVFFEIGSDELTTSARGVLKNLAAQLRGKPQKIEARGHVSAEFAARTGNSDEAMLLGVKRAAAVREYLVKVEKLQANRFRISSAGDSEPMSNGQSATQNPRVEVFMLDETVEDLLGTADERDAATIEISDSTRSNP
ncbi:OmpA family protein [Rubripirellula amarantea]|uniref:Flagellar motor protein MotB n=1 Tax=Rubripirellula amarantea TaxID=2527999 RepID=A0A5C5WRB5_9BACT|nr:OmpA family protein [Rubripirellula amarantea]MDA8744558.1 OmpA family protein [Rubripirellula amarantea]TWT53077.1 flagellar motor protein MotB [Rubripirellula amarantea]